METCFGIYHESNHGNKKTAAKSGVLSTRRYTVERPPLHQHGLAPSSLDGRCQWCPVTLRISEKECDAHTRPLRGALAHNLNSHLQSLRKEKEGQKDQNEKGKKER